MFNYVHGNVIGDSEKNIDQIAVFRQILSCYFAAFLKNCFCGELG